MVGFPWRNVFIILIIQAGDGVVAIMLYPMLPYMVRDFGIPHDRVGAYVGLLGTVFALVQIPSNIFWGRLSDNGP